MTDSSCHNLHPSRAYVDPYMGGSRIFQQGMSHIHYFRHLQHSTIFFLLVFFFPLNGRAKIILFVIHTRCKNHPCLRCRREAHH
jgi:hypothetical protein